MKKIFASLLAAALALSMAACAQTLDGGAAEPPVTNEDGAAPAETTPEGEAVTLRVFTNNPDRTRDQGLIEQMLFDSYVVENPNVTIEVEALEDDPYKVKFKAYAAGSDMPDLVSVWGQPGFIDEVIDGGILAELNPADYADYGFVDGSLNGFSKNGKLYGLPRNTDVMVTFYNKDMFTENSWTVPTTYDEYVALALAAKEADKLGVAVDGMGAWSLDIFLTDLLAKYNGSGIMDKIANAIAGGDWSDPVFADAAQKMQDTAPDLFMNGFESTDYDTAKNLFLSGQAAMAYFGSWEMAMALDAEFEVGAFAMPVVEGGQGTATDIAAWNGGGYSVTANGANKEEATKLLAYMFEPDNWTKLCWENGVCMSAQDFSAYATGQETPVQNEIVAIFTGASSITGTPINDMGTSQFKTNSEAAIQELAIGNVDPEGFYAKLLP